MENTTDHCPDYDELAKDPHSSAILNIIFDSVLKFRQQHCRFPGDCTENELEVDKYNILEIIKDQPNSPNSVNLYEPYVQVTICSILALFQYIL